MRQLTSATSAQPQLGGRLCQLAEEAASGLSVRLASDAWRTAILTELTVKWSFHTFTAGASGRRTQRREGSSVSSVIRPMRTTRANTPPMRRALSSSMPCASCRFQSMRRSDGLKKMRASANGSLPQESFQASWPWLHSQLQLEAGLSCRTCRRSQQLLGARRLLRLPRQIQSVEVRVVELGARRRAANAERKGNNKTPFGGDCFSHRVHFLD